MSTLRDIQAGFAEALLEAGQPPPSGLAATAPGSIPVRRFNVYRNNVVMSLTDVLEAYFPVVRRLLGDEFFRATTRSFILTQPPVSPVISRYGEDFPAFLAQFVPVADVPYLPDVARLEWLQQRAYHAADADAIDPQRLASVPAEDVAGATLVFHPAARVLSSPFPVYSIWKTNTFDVEVEPIDTRSAPEAVLIVRRHLDVRTLLLPRGAANFLATLMAGGRIGEAFEGACRDEPQFDPTPTFAALFELGAVIEIKAAPKDEPPPISGAKS